MSVIVCMLRGVNVGGHNKIKMDELCALCTSLKMREPRTFIQSGNVIFKSDEKDIAALTGRMQRGIERKFGFRPEVVTRTCSEMRKVIEGNPFAGRKGIEPNKFLVMFLAGEPTRAAVEEVSRLKLEPEEARITGRDVYLYYPNGLARPKTPWTALEKILKVSGTARNWNSVTKMMEIAEAVEKIS